MLPIFWCSSRWASSSCRTQYQHCLLPTPGMQGSVSPFLYFNRQDQHFTPHLPKLLQICSAAEHPHYPLDPICLLQSHKWRIKCCISPHYRPPNWGSSSFHSSQQLESEKNLWHFDVLLFPPPAEVLLTIGDICQCSAPVTMWIPQVKHCISTTFCPALLQDWAPAETN